MDFTTKLVSEQNPYAISSVVIAAVLLWAFFRGSEDISPVKFTVPIPQQLRDNDWNFGVSDEPEIRDGKIYPRCPADGRLLSESSIEPATAEQIDEAVRRAAAAQQKWAKTSFAARKKLLNTLLQYVVDNQEVIVQAACLDSGKTKIDASFGEILVTVEKLQWTIKHGERALAPSARPTNLLMCYKNNLVTYEPLGVIASCFSWNYPFHSWISTVISALFTGNAIICKPSEQTCWSSLFYLSIVRAALEKLGHSPDLVQNIICLPDTADHLTSHPGISHITFIGSRPVAHKVCAAAAKSLTPVCVELGGKDAAIVLDDKATIKAIDSIVPIVLRGTFQSAGQNCIGIERVIALPQVHDVLLERLKVKTQSLRLGSITLDTGDVDMGSMISPASFDRLEALVSSAVKSGAILHTGGKRYRHPNHKHGHYFEPTLISGVRPDMDIAQNEVFGPICTLMAARDIDHAIELANGTSYGLGASVFGAPTTTNRPVLQRVARQIKSGMVSINDFGAYYVCSLPFGGVKGSGYGRFGGAEGLQALCNVKSICQETWWANLVGIKTEIPPPLQYPVAAGNGYRACEGIVRTGYAPTWSQCISGVAGLLKALMAKA